MWGVAVRQVPNEVETQWRLDMIRHSTDFLAVMLLCALGCGNSTSPDDCPEPSPAVHGTSSQPDLTLVPSCEAQRQSND
jgi:hypothetical protein